MELRWLLDRFWLVLLACLYLTGGLVLAVRQRRRQGPRPVFDDVLAHRLYLGLVDLAKPIGVRFAPVALNAVVEQAAALVQTQLNKNRIALVQELADRDPVRHRSRLAVQMDLH